MQNLLRKLGFVAAIVCVFLVGWLSGNIVVYNNNSEIPFSFSIFAAPEKYSPSDHIKKEDIHVYNDKVLIDMKGVEWAEFTDTNSMDPFIDADANSLEIKPGSTDEIKIGDVISYKPKNFSGLVIHRVIETGKDETGWYAIAKGDNLKDPDPDKIRFEQISGVLIGVLY
jgi:hypothetical protein